MTVGKGDHPQMAQQFRLVKYSNLPRLNQFIPNPFSPGGTNPSSQFGLSGDPTAPAPIMNGEAGPPKNAANFAALTPLHFLERAAEVFPERHDE